MRDGDDENHQFYFGGCGGGVFVASTLDVDVADNRFEGNRPPQDDSPRDKDVRLLNCK